MNSQRALALGLTALAAATVLAGCSDKTGGNPTVAPSTEASRPAGAAPRVTEPIDPSRLLSDPCSALAESQAGRLGLSAGVPEQATDAPRCVWKYPEYQFNNVSLEGAPDRKDGLSDIYALKPQSAYFEPTEVAGHPGVYRSDDDQRTDGSCVLWLGLTDNAVMLVQGYFSRGSPQVAKSCQEVARVAEAALRTLKGGR